MTAHRLIYATPPPRGPPLWLRLLDCGMLRWGVSLLWFTVIWGLVFLIRPG